MTTKGLAEERAEKARRDARALLSPQAVGPMPRSRLPLPAVRPPAAVSRGGRAAAPCGIIPELGRRSDRADDPCACVPRVSCIRVPGGSSVPIKSEVGSDANTHYQEAQEVSRVRRHAAAVCAVLVPPLSAGMPPAPPAHEKIPAHALSQPAPTAAPRCSSLTRRDGGRPSRQRRHGAADKAARRTASSSERLSRTAGSNAKGPLLAPGVARRGAMRPSAPFWAAELPSWTKGDLSLARRWPTP